MTTLQDIHGFTFTSELSELKTLTIWQAIAYIMQKQKGVKEDLKKYKKDFDAIEFASIGDYLEIDFHKNNPAMIHFDEVRSKLIESFQIDEYELEGYIESFKNWDVIHSLSDEEKDHIKDGMLLKYLEIQDNQISHYLTELNNNRYERLSCHPIAFVLYKVLVHEIDLENDSSELKLANDRLNFSSKSPEYFHHEILIKKNSLKNWKNISSLKDLGLFDTSKNAQARQVRSDLIDNHLKVIGMLMNELRKAYPEIAKSDDPSSKKINISKLTKKLLDEAELAHIEFMGKTSLGEILGDAQKTLEGYTINSKIKC